MILEFICHHCTQRSSCEPADPAMAQSMLEFWDWLLCDDCMKRQEGFNGFTREERRLSLAVYRKTNEEKIG